MCRRGATCSPALIGLVARCIRISAERWFIIKTGPVLACVFGALERYLNFDDLDVVLLVIASVRANEQALDRPVTVERTTRLEAKAYMSRVGIHSTVRDGHVSACE